MLAAIIRPRRFCSATGMIVTSLSRSARQHFRQLACAAVHYVCAVNMPGKQNTAAPAAIRGTFIFMPASGTKLRSAPCQSRRIICPRQFNTPLGAIPPLLGRLVAALPSNPAGGFDDTFSSFSGASSGWRLERQPTANRRRQPGILIRVMTRFTYAAIISPFYWLQVGKIIPAPSTNLVNRAIIARAVASAGGGRSRQRINSCAAGRFDDGSASSGGVGCPPYLASAGHCQR